MRRWSFLGRGFAVKTWTVKELSESFGLCRERVARFIRFNPSLFEGVTKEKVDSRWCYTIPDAEINKLMGMKGKKND